MAKTNNSGGRSLTRDTKTRFKTPQASSSKANAAGYEKRQARKSKSSTSSDVYEYLPEKTRRSKVTLELDHDEATEYNVGLDGGNDVDKAELRARLVGENRDDEMIDSADDEEIDSDAAFEDEDEERFAGFFSSKKTTTKQKSAVRFADVNLNEDEDIQDKTGAGDSDVDINDDNDDEGDGDEFIDLLDVLDGKGDIDMGSDEENVPNSTKERLSPSNLDTSDNEDIQASNLGESGEDDSEGSEGENESDGEEKREITPDEDEPSPEGLDGLQNFISTLDPTTKKRKDPDDVLQGSHADTRPRKKRLFQERTEAGAESEFRVQSGSKLNLDDLLAPLASQSSTLLSLKKSAMLLAPSSSSKAKTLSAPLPQRTQERLDREAAYEQTKEEVDKWSGTMKRIREAEHLSFPLQSKSAGRVSNLELAAKFKPTTALETSIDALLKSAKMREEDLHHTEESMLETNKLSVEEVAQRRGELRKMRELMFRAEVKARRVSKIKSKMYRKIKRKERERLGEKIDEEAQGSDAEENRLKQEVARAKERATLRHKHTGKWARQMKGREIDVDSRREIEEMLARGEKLRRKIHGVGSDDSEGDQGEYEDDGDDGNADDGMERIKQGAFDELKRVEMEDGNIRIEQSKGKGVFEMKFMKDAMARDQHATNRVIDDFVKEMGGVEDNPDSDADQELDNGDPSSVVVASRAGGRVVYRPGTIPTDQKVVERSLTSLASDTSSVTLKSTDLLSPPPTSPAQPSRINSSILPTDNSNPWLIPRDPNVGAKVSRKYNEVTISKDSSSLEKSKNKLKKQAQKKLEERDKANEDAVVEIAMDNVLSVPSHTAIPAPSKKAKHQNRDQQKGVEESDGNDSDVNSEVEAQEKALSLKEKSQGKGVKAFEQRDLVALAFAGDNVVEQFEEVKRREIADDAPREVDTTIPGWGSWGGTGVQRTAPKPQRIKKIAGIDPTTRADYNKKHIIISEKRDKKAAKYLVKDLPYPYTSKAQFERTMEHPLGTEWNTRVSFQRGTLPRVVKKPGVIINPLEKLR